MRTELLQAAPSLARRLPAAAVSDVATTLPVAVMELPEGPWEAPLEDRPGHLGFLVLDGILLREVCITSDWSVEMLGAGDVLRPWLEDGASFVTARWEVLQPVRLAVLDGAAAVRIGRYPALVAEIVERALRRSRSLSVHAVIEGVHRIEERLLLLFWHLAEQRGEHANGEIVVPIRLTHAHLARLVGARRPTVTTALGVLERDGKVTKTAEGYWKVAGDPPRTGAFG